MVWDLAGNVWEFMKDDNDQNYGSDKDSSYNSRTHSVTRLSGGTTTTSRNAKAQFGPAITDTDPWGGLGFRGLNHNRTVRLGQGGLTSNIGSVRRGGSVGDEGKGLFSVALDGNTGSGYARTGFRCVYHPPSN